MIFFYEEDQTQNSPNPYLPLYLPTCMPTYITSIPTFLPTSLASSIPLSPSIPLLAFSRHRYMYRIFRFMSIHT